MRWLCRSPWSGAEQGWAHMLPGAQCPTQSSSWQGVNLLGHWCPHAGRWFSGLDESTVIAHASTSLLVEEALAGGQKESGLELAVSAPLGPGISQGSGGHLPAGRSLTPGQSVASQEPFTC